MLYVLIRKLTKIIKKIVYPITSFKNYETHANEPTPAVHDSTYNSRVMEVACNLGELVSCSSWICWQTLRINRLMMQKPYQQTDITTELDFKDVNRNKEK